MTYNDSSTCNWLRRFQTGDSLAAQRLWEKFFERLVHLAHRHLHSRYRRTVDAEDVALSAFHSFCQGVEQGRYPELTDPHSLWRLLVTITLRKVVHVMRDQNRQKRGGSQQAVEEWEASDEAQAAVEKVVGREPSPEFAAQLAEECDRLMQRLDSEELVQLAVWKLDGYTNDEIAIKWGRAVRTVERKLQLIRKIWDREPRE